ncbi:MAG: prepilin peptidase [Nitriliruptoraceae bacterium]
MIPAAITLTIAALAGLAAGSFATVAIARWPRGGRVTRPRRSRCDHCGSPVRAADNVPVISWLLLRGRCRACGTDIGLTEPVVELVTALLFVSTVVRWGNSPVVLALLVLMWALVVASAIDLRHQIIPNRLTFPLPFVLLATLVAARVMGANDVQIWRGLVYAVVVPGAMFAVSWLFARVRGQPGIGLGDVKFAVSIALVLGALGGGYVIVFAYVAIFTAVAVALALIAARRAGLASRIPFGPYLAFGAVAAVLVGDVLIAAGQRVLLGT